MKEKQVDMQQNILITNIQRFSLHDGPGIRTTVFLKGCSLRCPWCCNPENIDMKIEMGLDKGKNIIFGEYMSVEDLLHEILKDEIFFEGGGVTFSGGEAMLQILKMEPLLRKLKERNIHLCIETALFVSHEQMKIAVKYFDLFYVDIKIMDEKDCRQFLGGDLKQYIENISYLIECNCNFIVRMPIISGFTNSNDNVVKVAEFLQKMNINKIEILREHQMGAKKYEVLGKNIPKSSGITIEEMKRCREVFSRYNIEADILTI